MGQHETCEMAILVSQLDPFKQKFLAPSLLVTPKYKSMQVFF